MAFSIGDWVAHKRMKVIGKIQIVNGDLKEYTVRVGEHMPPQIWAFKEVELYQEKAAGSDFTI